MSAFEAEDELEIPAFATFAGLDDDTDVFDAALGLEEVFEGSAGGFT